MFSFFKKMRRQRRLKKEMLLIDKRDWGRIADFLPLSDEIQVYLVKSHWLEGIGTYQRFYSFGSQARALLIEEAQGYASENIIEFGLSPDEETLLVTKGDIENIRFFIEQGYFFKEENEFLFVQRAMQDERLEQLFINYAEKRKRLLSQKTESLLVQQGRSRFVLAYIKIPCEYGLTAQSEVELIKRLDKRLIYAYEKNYNWLPDAQDLIDAGWLD